MSEKAFPILSFQRKMAILNEVRSNIEVVLADPNNCWGPRYVSVIVETADGDRVIDSYGTVEGWDDSWGTYASFYEIAEAKLKTVKAVGAFGDQGCSTKSVGENYPFLLPKGGCLWEGAASAPGIWVAASGLTQEADEMVANIVLQAFLQAARAEVARRLAANNEEEMILR